MSSVSSRLTFVFFLIFIFSCITECGRVKIPDGIELCKRWDPFLDDCLKHLFETLRPRLIPGIPEIDLPSLDPLFLQAVDVPLGRQGGMKLRNLKVTGVSNFNLHRVQTDIRRGYVGVRITFPFLKYEGLYDVNGRFMNFNLKGRGPVKGNATGITATAVLKGKVIESDGERYAEFVNAKVNVTLKDYGIQIDRLFADKQLNSEVNKIMNDKQSRYRKFSIMTSKPIIDKVASRMVLEIVNRISRKFSFEELFE